MIKPRPRFTIARAIADYLAVGERLTPTRVSLFSRWRAQGTVEDDTIRGASPFDEVVVASWLHVERMNEQQVWMRVGPLVIWATRKEGRIDLTLRREPDEHACVVTVEGDLTADAATDHDKRLRALQAYEDARGWDRKRAPARERLQRAMRAVGL